MRWLWPTLTAAIVADGLTLRRRIEALDVLEPSDEPLGAYRLITGAGVVVDDATARAAAAYARGQGLDAVDLVPADMPVERLADLMRLVDTETYRDNALATGHGALHAVLVTEELATRARLDVFEGVAPAEMVDLTIRVKAYAPRSTGIALAPTLHALPEGRHDRVDHLTQVIGSPLTVGGLALDLALIAHAVRKRRAGPLAAAAARVLQPVVLTSGTAATPRDMPGAVPRRLVGSLLDLPRALTRRREVPPEESADAGREDYEKMLADGIERFFEPRRPDCPVCASTDLGVKVVIRDNIQCKPGEFVLEECAGCGHVFQNPRLSLEGLDFYYRDFYDGTSERMVEGIFNRIANLYEARADMVREYRTPRRWLDVGGGHGHFCLAAKNTWPEATFDVLDISDSIEEAERKGWVGTAYRGMFPDMAGELSGRYDVVSMSHYLEHTRDQRAEIAAAATALAPGGLLLVEVPDPSSRIAPVLGRYWFPWFQPQHQHFLSVENLKRLMVEQGFTPLVEERAEVHIPVDFSAAAGLFVNRLYPRLKVPWRPPATPADRAKRVAALVAGTPVVVAGVAVDIALRPLGGKHLTSNAYRVLARRDPEKGVSPGDNAR